MHGAVECPSHGGSPLGGIHPLKYQLEEPRPDARPAREGVPKGGHGEQHKPYDRRKGNHHQPVSPRALEPEPGEPDSG
jgi:hypothetical protein